MAACGGSQPSAPTAPPAPPTLDTNVAAGTVFGVVSGETGEAIVGAQVVLAGRRYDTDSIGQISLIEPVPYGATVDVIAPTFFDRQTLLRRNGTRRFVLWPRSTPWGLFESYTAELVYTYATSEPPPVGTSPLWRIRQNTREAVVIVSDEIRAAAHAYEAHQVAVGHLNAALDGKITYALSPTRPTTGVVFETRVDPADPVCADRVLGYARMSSQSGEIVSGHVVYCSLDQVNASLVGHELGHTMGLQHAPDGRDLMHPFIRPGRERFSRAESLILNMLFERPGGNRFPDNDRDAAAAASGQRISICY